MWFSSVKIHAVRPIGAERGGRNNALNFFTTILMQTANHHQCPGNFHLNTEIKQVKIQY